MIKNSVAIAPVALDTAPVLFRGNVFRSMERAKDLGYNAVEIHTKKADELSPKKVSEKCRELGLEISAVATGMAHVIDKLCLIDDSTIVRQKTIDRIFQFIDWAAQVNSPVIIGSLRGIIPDLQNRERYDERFYSGMNVVLERAQKAKVTILLEIINRYENNYINTVKEYLEYTKPIACNNLFAHLDTFHMNIEEANIVDAIKLCGNCCGYMHLADNNRQFLGAGSLDFERIIEASLSVGYHGYFSLECLPLPTAEVAAEKSIRFIKALNL